MTDVNQLVTEQLDIWVSSIEKKSSAGRGKGGRVSLHGIKKLRELILELAVRGKLVQQEVSDGRADILVSESLLRREELIQKKTIKKPKSVKPMPDEMERFDPPRNWEMPQLGELAYLITDGTHHTPKYKETGVAFISVKDIDGKTVSFDDCKYITQEEHQAINDRCNPEKGDLLICRIGTLGRVTIVDTDRPFSLFVSVGLIKTFGDLVLPKYLHLALSSPFLLRQFQLIKAGGSHTNKLNLGDLPSLYIPLPPLDEQSRIVAKVDELMTLCDALEAKAEDSLKAHQVLVETCLATLTNSQSPEELTQNWTRIEAHFDTLFTTEESLAELDKTVLQLGMMGLLVKQDLSTSSMGLLETARKTRAALVARKEAKAFKAKANNEVLDWPFILPSGWSWLRLGEAAVLITKGSSPKWQGVSYTDDPSEVMFVTSENVGRFEMLLDNPKFVERKFNTVEPRSILKAGDYLMNIVGASIGRTAIYPGPDGANINQAVCLIRVLPGLFDPRFLIAFFNSEFCRGYMFDKQVDNARANLSMGNISQFLIPVPPIEEQVAIAEKLELLSGLSSNLSRRLQAGAGLSKSLADTLTSKIH